MNHDRRHRHFAILVSTFLLLGPAAVGQSLVKDFQTTTTNTCGGYRSYGIFPVGGGLLFAGNDAGLEDRDSVWFSRGAAGSEQKILNMEGFNLTSPIEDAFDVGGGLVVFSSSTFIFNSWSYGDELYVTDGTTAGTTIIDLWPGPSSGVNKLLGTLGNRVVFSGSDGTDSGLWITDGTVAGTTLLAAVEVVLPSWSSDRHGIEYLGRYYFVADDGVHGRELWSTDGTAAGTQLVMDIHPSGNSNVEDLTVFGSRLLFSAESPSTGRDLFKIEGTPSNVVPLEVVPGAVGAQPGGFTVVGSNVFFHATTAAFGTELFRTDGVTVAMASDINPGVLSSNPDNFFDLGGTLVFTAGRAPVGYELWISDGTPFGTVLLADLTPGIQNSEFYTGPPGFEPHPIGVVIGNRLMFGVDAGGTGVEPWVTDGTPAGTQMLGDLDPGAASSFPTRWVAYGGEAFFRADTAADDCEIWATDGTPQGTAIRHDLGTVQPDSSEVRALTTIGDRAVFVVDTGSGNKVHVTDGTGPGTVALGLTTQLRTNRDSSRTAEFVRMGDRIYFGATDTGSDVELWETDGTPAGTSMVSDIEPGAGGSYPRYLAVWQDRLYFRGSINNISSLCCSDGTAAGTQVIAPMRVEAEYDEAILALGDRMIVRARDDLYSSQGTAATTFLIDTVTLSRLAPAVVLDGFVYFFGSGGGLNGLWRTDGTVAGTEHVLDLDPLDPSTVYSYVEMIVFEGKLLIAAKHSLADGTEYGYELLTSDGTAAGTQLLLDIVPGPDGSYAALPSGFTRAHDRVFFVANSIGHGRELWCTDGTQAGTAMVVDLESGLLSGVDQRPLAVGVGRRVVFAGHGPDGRELFVSDGTAAGTSQLFDLWPGSEGGARSRFYSEPTMTRIGDQVLFVGDDGSTGYELYAMPAALLEATEIDFFGSGCAGSNGAPRIDHTDVPALGTPTFAVDVHDAYPTFPLILAASALRQDVPLPGGCVVHVAAPVATVPATADANGSGSVPIPIPATPSLLGSELVLQWLTIDPAGSLGNFAAFSNGMRIRVGRS